MASRFKAKLQRVLEVRGDAITSLSVSQAEQVEHEQNIEALIQSAEQEVATIFAELDAKNPCWRCWGVGRGHQPFCMVDGAPVPADGCKRERSRHAG